MAAKKDAPEQVDDTALTPEAIAAVRSLQDATERAGRRVSFSEAVERSANTVLSTLARSQESEVFGA